MADSSGAEARAFPTSGPAGASVSATRPEHSGQFPVPPPIPDHKLLQRIGAGSYGEVWLAHTVMGAWRAVKVVHRSRFDNNRPFEREFRGIQKFEPVSRTHPSQLSILHVGRAADDSSFYYVMELADNALDKPAAPTEQRSGLAAARDQSAQTAAPGSGSDGNIPFVYLPRTLRWELEQRGRLPFRECLEIALTLTRALEHLHANGLVHRDIKPSNIVFINGVAKLADIGLVARADDTLSFVGTRGFVPPEGAGTPQADIYSLGKVLYEISTGRDRHEYPELPTNLRDLDDQEKLVELNQVILKACRPDARQRYLTAAELHTDLLLLRSGKSIGRWRAMEHRFRALKGASVGIAAAAVLGMAGFLYQSHQTSIVKQLASNNLSLLKSTQRASEERKQLLQRSLVANGSRAWSEGDGFGALSWFVQALKLDDLEPQRRAEDRLRIGLALRYSPKIIGVLHFDEAGGVEPVFSQAGDQVLLCGDDGSDAGTVITWDLKRAEVIHRLQVTKVLALSVSPDARWLLTYHTNYAFRLWDRGTEKPISPPLWHTTNGYLHACFSSNGTRLATASADRNVKIWEVPSGRLLITLPQRNNSQVAAFSPDGKWVATGSGIQSDDLSKGSGEARVWNAETGQPLTDWLPHSEEVGRLQFSPDGTRLVVAAMSLAESYDRAHYVRLWDLTTSQPLGQPLKHEGTVTGVAFSPNGSCLATAGADGVVKLWSAKTGEPVAVLRKQPTYIQAIRFSPDGRWLATASLYAVQLWDVDTGAPVGPALSHDEKVDQIAFTPDGSCLVTSGLDRLVKFWSLTSLDPNRPLLRLTGRKLTGADFSPDGARVLAVDDIGDLRVWNAVDAAAMTPIMTPARHGANLLPQPHLEAVFSPDGSKIVAGAGDYTARIWDSSTGKEITPPLVHSNYVGAVAFSPDGRRILTSSADGTARVWNADTGQPTGVLLSEKDAVGWPAAFSPDGTRMATAGSSARIWDAATGAPLSSQLKEGNTLYRCTFSPDGSVLAVGGRNRTVTVWDARTGAKSCGPLEHDESISAIAFSPDGKRLVSGSLDSTARIWELPSGKLRAVLNHTGPVNAAVFSHDGRCVATASTDRTARLWSASTGEPLSPPLKHLQSVQAARFSPDDRQLITASFDGTAQIWELPASDWSTDELQMLVGLLANRNILPRTLKPKRTPESLEQSWIKFKTQSPADFARSEADLERWHQRQLALCELTGSLFAARFHLDRLIVLRPQDAELKTLRTRLAQE